MTFFKWELVILQLNRFKDVPYEKLDMPYGMTQDGIATALCISRAHACIELKKIQNKGYVDILPAHVMYRPKTLNVYSLTSNGRRKAMELLDRAREESIDVDSLFTVRPMRKALNTTPQLVIIERELKKTLEYIEAIRYSKTRENLYPIYMCLLEAQKAIVYPEVDE